MPTIRRTTAVFQFLSPYEYTFVLFLFRFMFCSALCSAFSLGVPFFFLFRFFVCLCLLYCFFCCIAFGFRRAVFFPYEGVHVWRRRKRRSTRTSSTFNIDFRIILFWFLVRGKITWKILINCQHQFFFVFFTCIFGPPPCFSYIAKIYWTVSEFFTSLGHSFYDFPHLNLGNKRLFNPELLLRPSTLNSGVGRVITYLRDISAKYAFRLVPSENLRRRSSSDHFKRFLTRVKTDNINMNISVELLLSAECHHSYSAQRGPCHGKVWQRRF